MQLSKNNSFQNGSYQEIVTSSRANISANKRATYEICGSGVLVNITLFVYYVEYSKNSLLFLNEK